LRADPTKSEHVGPEQRAELDAWLSQRQKIERENFKETVLKAVVGPERYEAVYDGYYGKASGHVHGYETIVRDVHREYYNGVEDPQLDYGGKVFDLNDHAVVCIENLLHGLDAVNNYAVEKRDFSGILTRLDQAKVRVGMDPASWVGGGDAPS
jgi:hypothetical protein